MSNFQREAHWAPYGVALLLFFGLLTAAGALAAMQSGQGNYHLNGQAKLIEHKYVTRYNDRYIFEWVMPDQFAGKRFDINVSECSNSYSLLAWIFFQPKVDKPVDVYRTDGNRFVVGPCYDFSLWTAIVNSIVIAGLIFFGKKLVGSLSPEERLRSKQFNNE